MPKELENCVQGVIKSGKTESEAYAICGDKTGWVRKKGGGWKNKKTGKIYESFLDMFIEGAQQDLKWLRDTKGIRKEIQRLKQIANKNPDDEKDIMKAIEYLENKLKG